MPGIAGWMALARHAPDDSTIGAVLETLVHRGAGGAGACVLPSRTHRVVFGHRRAAQAAAQPLCDEAAGLALTLDGEIYNAAELAAELAVSAAAPERVVLAAYRRWDHEFVRRLRGRFALALWDAARERLVLARDRFGEKPLYRCETNGSVFFASEAKALLRIPGIRAETDLEAMREALQHGFVPGPRTLFRGIRKLSPATYALWQHGLRREARYWTPPDREPPPRSTAGRDAVPGFLAGLDEAVRERMNGEPAGAFLSGGIDSSMLAAVMRRHQPKVKTFAVALAGAAGELRLAARAAEHLGTEHHELTVTRDELVAALPRLVASRDAPLADPADVALHLLAREASRSVSGVLTGDGGDEILAGEPRYVRARLGLPFDDASPRKDHEALAGPALQGKPAAGERAPETTRMRRALYLEQTRTLPDRVLERDDRIGVAIEARTPYTDHRLAEYVGALPDSVRVRGLRTKWILRESAKQLLPRALRNRSHARLRVPLGEWLRDGLRETLLDHLHARASLTRVYYNAPVLDRVLEEHLKGRQDHQQLLWTLLNLEIWHRTYRPG